MGQFGLGTKLGTFKVLPIDSEREREREREEREREREREREERERGEREREYNVRLYIFHLLTNLNKTIKL